MLSISLATLSGDASELHVIDKYNERFLTTARCFSVHSMFIKTIDIAGKAPRLKNINICDYRAPQQQTAMHLAHARANDRVLHAPNYGDPPHIITCKVRWGPDFIYTLSDAAEGPSPSQPPYAPPSIIVDASNLGFNVETDAAGAALSSCTIREHGGSTGGERRRRELLPELRRAAANGGGLLLLAFDGAQQWGQLSGRNFAEGASLRVRNPPGSEGEAP